MINKKKFHSFRLFAIYIILFFYSLSFLKLSASDLWFGMISLTWPDTEAVITETALLEKSDKDETLWEPEVSYTYVIDGTSYRGNKISFSRSHVSKEQASEIMKEYYPGDTITIYYSLSHPALSCIKPGLGKRVVFFTLLGLSGMLAIVFSVYRERKKGLHFLDEIKQLFIRRK